MNSFDIPDQFPEIPEEHRTAFNVVHNLLAWECRQWQHFKALFGNSYAIALLNEVAGSCFAVIQAAMLDSVMIGLARLVDPQPRQAGRGNLTIESLRPLAQSISPAALKDFDDEFAAARLAATNLLTHRNKRIAHMDNVWGEHPEKIPPIEAEAIVQTLAILKRMMNAFHFRFRGVSCYEVFDERGSARDLIARLSGTRGP